MEASTWPVKIRHLAKCRALLCVDCTYCVLPHALDRHLKDFHHLPRSERQPYLDYTRTLDLADYDEVVTPAPGEPAIPGLPVHDGYCCTFPDCTHLCITAKRMQAHWREKHTALSRSVKSGRIHGRRVRLQTLFRGSALRYFIVAGSPDGSTTKFTGASSRKSLALTRRVAPRDPNETFEEWLLTTHFSEACSLHVLPCAGTNRHSWHNQILHASASKAFLRYAVLSITACQVAYQNPQSRSSYARSAKKYQMLAIKSLPPRMAEINHETFFEIFNFTRLMTILCIAEVQRRDLADGTGSPQSLPMLPEWIAIQHRGAAIVWPYRGGGRIGTAMHGPVDRLYQSNLMPRSSMPSNPHDAQLQKLVVNLESLATWSVDIVCLEALDTLRRIWAIPYANDVLNFRDVSLMFAVRSPLRYFELVEEHDPVALIVFAHFCVLWKLSEDQYWYMRGHSKTMLTRVIQRLDLSWQGWIAWPVEMVFTPETEIIGTAETHRAFDAEALMPTPIVV